MQSGQLLVMLKAPVLGAVKTRLAESIGAKGALQIYQRLLNNTISTAAESGWPTQIWWTGEATALPAFPTGFTLHEQPAGDLGQRMGAAFAHSFTQFPNQPAVIIGADCWALSTQILDAAFDALQHQQTVVGPATDGGYYLLGMRQWYPELMQGIAWSTARVAAQTKAKMTALDLSCHTLVTLNDIDTLEDLLQSPLRYEIDK